MLLRDLIQASGKENIKDFFLVRQKIMTCIVDSTSKSYTKHNINPSCSHPSFLSLEN